MMLMQVCIVPHFLPMNNACPVQRESKIRKKNAKHLIICITSKNKLSVIEKISFEIKGITGLITYRKK